MCTYAASNAMSRSSRSLGGSTPSAYSSVHMAMYWSVHTGSRKRRVSHSSFQCPSAIIFSTAGVASPAFLQTLLPQSAKVFEAANTGFLYRNGSVKAAGMNGHDRRAFEDEQDFPTARACRRSLVVCWPGGSAATQ